MWYNGFNISLITLLYMSDYPANRNYAPRVEDEKKSKIFLIYRNNQLFGTASSKIAEAFVALGYDVITQSFPQETDESVIGQWGDEHQSELKGATLLTDETFVRSLPAEVR